MGHVTKVVVQAPTPAVSSNGTPDSQSVASERPGTNEDNAGGVIHWLYRDLKGQLQGPFTSEKMAAWHSRGMLPLDLDVRRSRDTTFAKIHDYFPQPRTAFVSAPVDPPKTVRQAPSKGNGNTPSSKAKEQVLVLNPLAIRFAQPRINNFFAKPDGREVLDTIKELKIEPFVLDDSDSEDSFGRDDLFIRAPFPVIEVVQFRAKLRDEDGSTVKDEVTGIQRHGEERWFTLDNRRLYCLQRAAIKAWPSLCYAAVKVVDSLDSTSKVLRKFRTTSDGTSVRIGSSQDVFENLPEWSWRDSLPKSECTERVKSALSSVEIEELRSEPRRAFVSVQVRRDLKGSGASEVRRSLQGGAYCYPGVTPGSVLAQQMGMMQRQAYVAQAMAASYHYAALNARYYAGSAYPW